jgi:hypothetical protein
VREPTQAHRSVLRGPVGIPYLRQTMATIIRSAPPPPEWSGGTARTLIIAPTHLHRGWCQCLKGCNPVSVSGKWEKRNPNGDVYVCTARTWGTAPQPMPVWWRVVVDCTDPETRHSLSRRCTGKRLIVRLLPPAKHKWCIAPWHTTSADNMHVLDVLHGDRHAWMTCDHPRLQAPVRRAGEYGQWLVDLQYWRLHTQLNNEQCANTHMQQHAVMVVPPPDNPYDDSSLHSEHMLSILRVVPHRSWMAVYNAWTVWVRMNLIANADTVQLVIHGYLESLRRICSTQSAQCVLPPSTVWDIHQATCLLPIHLNPKPHREQWMQIQKNLWASLQNRGDAPECIVCTTVLAQCPLVITECGHIVGACCAPKMVERGVVPPGYRCPECRRSVIIGQTAWLVHGGLALSDECGLDRKIGMLVASVLAKKQMAALVITHYEESMHSIVDMLRAVVAGGATVSCGKQIPAISDGNQFIHVAQPLDIRALDLSAFHGAYVYDEGFNFEWLVDTLHRNGMASGAICLMRYTGTIEEASLNSPPFQQDAYFIESLLA